MRIGSLFSGAGGLDMAVQAVFGGEVVWHSEIDKAASKLLAYRFPGVPNLGSVTDIDWAAVPPVDVLCGGFPCQDVSAAGKRAGIKAGTRSGLWSVFAEAIDALRPQFVVVENVRGLLSATAHRDMESDEADMGVGGRVPVLRAAGAVLGDLTDLGYDAQWATVAASSVGAPHRRERVFILAFSSNTEHVGSCREANDARGWESDVAGRGGRCEPEGCGTSEAAPGNASDSSGYGRDEGRPESAGQQWGFDAALGGDGHAAASFSGGAAVGQQPGGASGAETGAHPGDGSGDHRGERADGVALLPTPAACNPNDGETPETWLRRRDDVKDRVGNGSGRGMPLSIAVQLLPTPQARDHKGTDSEADHNRRSPGMDAVSYHFPALLPTPKASDGEFATPRTSGRPIEKSTHLQTIASLEPTSHWGKYEPAIRRWEAIVGPAPAPTEPNKNGNPRLSAAFSEWLMGWPAGWVTDPAIGISRNDQLRIVGNGVCPQQAIVALRYLLSVNRVSA